MSDDGPGISPEDRERIFERFQRASVKHAGTGLGLAIAREIARRHGGDVTVEAGPGGGATFRVTLASAPS